MVGETITNGTLEVVLTLCLGSIPSGDLWLGKHVIPGSELEAPICQKGVLACCGISLALEGLFFFFSFKQHHFYWNLLRKM